MHVAPAITYICHILGLTANKNFLFKVSVFDNFVHCDYKPKIQVFLNNAHDKSQAKKLNYISAQT